MLSHFGHLYSCSEPDMLSHIWYWNDPLFLNPQLHFSHFKFSFGFVLIPISKSFRLWNFKDDGSLKTRFLAKNQHPQRNFFKKSVDELQFVKKCQNRTFRVNFGCQKLIEFFQKKILSKNINLGDHYLLKTFFF